jgi:hypothetical protein
MSHQSLHIETTTVSSEMKITYTRRVEGALELKHVLVLLWVDGVVWEEHEHVIEKELHLALILSTQKLMASKQALVSFAFLT